MELGAGEARASNAKFVNLRAGKIAETSKEPKEGFVPDKTVNASGVETHFYAKHYDFIAGYVDEIRWHTHTLPNNTTLTGWKITINTGSDVFILDVGSMDRPFDRLMSVLCNVDFRAPVKLVGFMGSYDGKKQKVLLVKQEDPMNGEEFNVQPMYEAKFISQILVKKLRERIELTDQEKKNLVFLPDGSIDPNYPYIKQGLDNKWQFSTWVDFLMQKMYDDVIPAVKAAKEERGDFGSTTSTPEQAAPEFSGPPAAEGGFNPAFASDDDIPF